MPFDLVLDHALVPALSDGPVSIAIGDGLIAAIGADVGPGRVHEDAGFSLVVPGFVDSHIHLDKACILDRCRAEGSLAEAIGEVARLKADFSEADIHARAEATLRMAILQGTTRIRTHAEIDTRIGLRGFHALQRLKRDYAFAVDLEICVFPQEGLTNDPGAEALLVKACEQGADLVGGCPYTDTDPEEQIARIFAIARRFDLDVDFHLDFDLDPSWTHLDAVIAATELNGWEGRVAVGHVTKLSAMPNERVAFYAARLARAGVAVTVLPATDLFLMGRGRDHSVPRGVAPAHLLAGAGVTCSLATNNVMNPFTPFGDCSLNRMANLYANIAQLSRKADMALCLDMVTHQPARLMRCEGYGIAVGNPADMVVIDAKGEADAVARIAPVLMGFKRGVKTFDRPRARLIQPADA